jgi:RND family efflux transporter MFP subunit
MKKVVGFVVLAGVLGVIGWQVLVRRAQIQEAAQRPGRGGRPAVAVEVAPVRRATVRDIGRFTGTLMARAQFVVAPKVAGRLRQLHVHIGDLVCRGDLIAVLDDEEYAIAVEQAQAELDVAQANVEEAQSSLAQAEREYQRVQPLREKGIASESELDVVRAAYKAQEAKSRVTKAVVAQREAALRAARVRQGYTQVRAAWEEADAAPRVVGERFVDEGALLTANAPIVSLLDIDTLIAIIQVVERDYPKIVEGQPVTLTTDAFPERTFTGTVKRIAPLVKETSRQARVEVEVSNPGRTLRPGLFVRMSIVFATHQDATVVPVAALARRDGKMGVYVIGDAPPADPNDRANTARPAGPPAGPRARGRSGAPGPDTKGPDKIARYIPLTLGIEDGPLVEVLAPTDLRGEVVTLGQHLLEDGAPVTVAEPPSTAPASQPATRRRPAPPAELTLAAANLKMGADSRGLSTFSTLSSKKRTAPLWDSERRAGPAAKLARTACSWPGGRA